MLGVIEKVNTLTQYFLEIYNLLLGKRQLEIETTEYNDAIYIFYFFLKLFSSKAFYIIQLIIEGI